MPLSQKTYTQFSIGPVQLGPSIQEGEINTPSLLLGPRPAIPILRVPPTLLQSPVISGDPRIPAILTLNPGVYGGSPQPVLSYQWIRNGIPIPGEINLTYTTVAGDNALDIYVEVYAQSQLGNLTTNTNIITPVLYENIEIQEAEIYVVSSPTVINLISVSEVQVYYISGMRQLNTVEVNLFEIYIITEEV